MRNDIYYKLSNLAQTVQQAGGKERWKTYFDTAREEWVKFHDASIQVMEDAKKAIADGKEPPLGSWDVIQRSQSHTRKGLMDRYGRLSVTAKSGAFDNTLQELVATGRQLEDKDIAEAYSIAIASGAEPRLVLDHFASAQEDIIAEGAKTRSMLDELVAKVYKGGQQQADWDKYWAVRNKAWESYYDYVHTRWDAASRVIVKETLRPGDTIESWLARYAVKNPDYAKSEVAIKRMRNNIMRLAHESGIKLMGSEKPGSPIIASSKGYDRYITPTPVNVIWRVNDVESPVTVTGFLQRSDGETYYSISEDVTKLPQFREVPKGPDIPVSEAAEGIIQPTPGAKKNRILGVPR